MFVKFGTSRRRGVAAASAVAAVGMLAAACGSSATTSNPANSGGSKGSAVVGSANFPENEVLAEIYALALQAKGVKVTTKLNIGSREIYYPQVEKGAITVFPEYNGSLLTGPVDPSSTAASTTQVDAALKAKLPSSLEILNPSAAQDKDSITVTAATASQYHLTSIGDLKPYASKWTIGAPPEFKTRSDGLAGLKKNYGLTFKAFDPLDESGPLTLKALTTGKVQAADVFTTTPYIATNHLVVLTDPKNNFAAQNVIPLVYKKAMTPTIVSVLNEVSAKLTQHALLQLNVAVEVNHESYTTAATNWLKSVGMAG